MKYTLLFFIIILFGCAPQYSVTKRPEFKLVKGSTITVVSKNYDYANVQGEIEHILLEKGFNVVSEEVVKKSIEIDENYELNKSSISGKTSIYNQTALKSVYMLTFTYSTRADIPHGRAFTNFTGRIVELISGKLVASLRFSQGDFGSTSIPMALQNMLSEL